MWHFGILTHSPLTSGGVVHSTWSSRATWHLHAPTFNKWHKKYKNKKVTLHIIDTWHNARVCVDFFSSSYYWRNSWYKGEKCDNKEWNLNYKHPFPRVRDIVEWVILWRLTLRRLGCTRDWFLLYSIAMLKFVFSHTWLSSQHMWIVYYIDGELGVIGVRPAAWHSLHVHVCFQIKDPSVVNTFQMWYDASQCGFLEMWCTFDFACESEVLAVD